MLHSFLSGVGSFRATSNEHQTVSELQGDLDRKFFLSLPETGLIKVNSAVHLGDARADYHLSVISHLGF